MTETRTLPIDEAYCKDWTLRDALRELIQNALDTNAVMHITAYGDFHVIQDEGTGVSLTDFLLGRTSKTTEDDSIGQFGEGLAIACLVLCRHKRRITIQSRGRRYDAYIAYDAAWESDILTFNITDAETGAPGTKVTVECTSDEMDEARSLFLKLRPKPILQATPNGEVLDSPGDIYINGLWVSRASAIFGYNLKQAKKLVNRDRASVGREPENAAVSNLLGKVSETTLLTKLFYRVCDSGNLARETYIECNVCPAVEDKAAWTAAALIAWGDKACLHDSANWDANLTASDAGWRILDLPWSMEYTLKRFGVLPTSVEVADKLLAVPEEALATTSEEALVEGARKVAQKACRAAGLGLLAPSVIGKLPRLITGLHADGIIYLDLEGLARGEAFVVGTLLHEQVHICSSAKDHTTEFENAAFSAFAHLAVVYYDETAEVLEG